jgi:hypothetical protein
MHPDGRDVGIITDEVGVILRDAAVVDGLLLAGVERFLECDPFAARPQLKGSQVQQCWGGTWPAKALPLAGPS